MRPPHPKKIAAAMFLSDKNGSQGIIYKNLLIFARRPGAGKEREMACYAINPVLLYTTGCCRTVCIHCRIDFRLSGNPFRDGRWFEEFIRNPMSIGAGP
jgi:hypothetical protein